MADVTLLTDQNVTGQVAIETTDGTVIAVAFDEGTFSATMDNTTDFTVSSDGVTVNVRATGTPSAADATLTVAGSVAGVALQPFTATFSAVTPPPVAAKVAVTFGTPATNAA